MKIMTQSGAAIVLGLSAQTASALPLPSLSERSSEQSLERVASWRYYDNCGWQGGRWVVDLGAGKFVICRPNRPNRAYNWRREVNREGWYDRRTRAWHFNNW